METKHIRNFEIEHITFSLNASGGRLYLQSLHPYDETESHWAFMDTHDGSWRVYRAGRYQITLGSAWERLSPEQAAVKLLAIDRAAGLKPRRAIW